jgi:general secretion pathway protein K
MSQAGQRGVALLSAMITVTLVAAISASAFWVRWRSVEVESSEQARNQTTWLIRGALSWSRLILLEDAKANATHPVDHLSEPWAIELNDSKISGFVSNDKKQLAGDTDVYLSGRILDEQGKLNARNLLDGDVVDQRAFAIFERLFERLGVPISELETIVQNLTTNAKRLTPLSERQLSWLGLSEGAKKQLDGFVTWLPVRTPVNVNTTSREVLSALLPSLSDQQIDKVLVDRSRDAWRSTADFRTQIGPTSRLLTDKQISVSSFYFRVVGQIANGLTKQSEEALMKKEVAGVAILWHRHRLN